MGVLDKFLDAIKLNPDDDYDDDEFFDDEDFDEYDDDEVVEEKPRKRFFKKLDEDEEDFDDYDDFAEEPVKKTTKQAIKQPKPAKVSRAKEPKKASKITPMRNTGKKAGNATMEVIVVKPTSMEDTREIADALIDRCTVVLNLEGIDVEVAQRIIDFASGCCYAIDGNLQKISNYIFILTPSNVDISGDYQDILNGAFDLPSIRTEF